MESSGFIGIGAALFLGVVLLLFVVLDLVMVISLMRPGDERNQVIVWKASAYTLLSITGATLLDIIFSIATKQPLLLNSLLHLELTAIIYFISLQIFKRKYGG